MPEGLPGLELQVVLQEVQGRTEGEPGGRFPAPRASRDQAPDGEASEVSSLASGAAAGSPEEPRVTPKKRSSAA